jgi:hypothetical protein
LHGQPARRAPFRWAVFHWCAIRGARVAARRLVGMTEMRDVARYLASEDAPFTTGRARAVGGGWTLTIDETPNWLLARTRRGVT